MASFPSLAGRDMDYIAKRLKQYRAGEKVGSNSALMMPNAANLSDAEIANLATYISQNFN
jgi:cytochrome c553